MRFLNISLCIAVLGLSGFVKAQIGLQVDFESGFPLRRDEVLEKASPLKGDDDVVGAKSVVGTFDDQSLPWRLPRTVEPLEYTLTITPILDDNEPGLGGDFTAPGTVSIIIRALTSTSNITLHVANETTVHGFEVNDERMGTPIATEPDAEQNYLYQFYTIKLVTPLVENATYVLNFNFTSQVKNGLDGLYRSRYVDPYTNTTKWLATTQMEALHARQVFPCFDESAMKAVFNIKIGRRRDRIALATTQSLRNSSMVGFPNWEWEEFAPTVKMPTYLLAIIVSEFTFEDAPVGLFPNKAVRTYAPKHYIDLGGGVYAADRAARLLNYFEGYYVEKYPLMKMDSAAVPDFFFGAMENYGLNIYRETALLYFSQESTEAERYSITRILAHELGHQWFGNLISPRWWTHIWLNEGFATFLAAQGTENVDPEFEAWERFQNDVVQNSMAFDARSDYSHSVKIDEEAWATNDAMFWFDRMAYEKAGSLILMMRGFLTEPVLQSGLRTYLNTLQFSAAAQDDLFHHLNTVAENASRIPTDLTMKQIMDSWTIQPGFPLLRVSVADDSGVYISQERFLNNEVQVPGHVNQETGLWYVPMAISRKAAPNPTSTEWLYNDIAMKYFEANTSEWIVVNSDANGFYRVIYDTALTQLIRQELLSNRSFIPARARSQLLDDYFNAAWQKHINIETALSLADFIGSDDSIVVWNTVLTNLRKPFNLLSNGGSFYTTLRAFLIPKLQNALSLTGGINNPNLPEQYGAMPVIRHLQFLDWLCGFEEIGCLAYSQSLVSQWMAQPDNPAVVRRDIKPVVYCSAVANGNDATFNFIHGQYIGANITVKQRGTLLNSLACTKEISTINLLLEEILNDEFYFQATHGSTMMTQLARNPLARSQMISFWRQPGKTAEIIAKPGLGINSITGAITALANYISTQSELDDLNAYLEANPDVQSRSLAAVRTIQQNIDWVRDFASDMSKYFNAI